LKIFITADIEGVAGVTNWNETELTHPESAYAKAQMTQEVKGACLGANKAGAVEILIKDAHGDARTINISDLPENIKIMRGWARNPYVMMAGIDATFDAALFIGYHSGSGEAGNPLSHTMHCDFDYIKINSQKATEFMINAYTASLFNVPCLFVSGDEMLCQSAQKLNPNIITAPVSKGIGDASVSIHPQLAVRLIQEGAEKALQSNLERHLIKLPERFEIEIRFRQHYRAYKASFYPNVKPINSQTIYYQTNDYFEFLRLLFFV
jgi:D-amino peptidase